MRFRKLWLFVLGGIGLVSALFGFENATKPWREYPAFEYNDFPVPPDYQQKTEWAFARLMYPNTTNPNVWGIGFRRFRGYGGDWREGGRGIFWTMDYPRSDRHFSLAIRRLTRLDARSVEQPLNFDEGSQYDWPWLYGVEVGHWELTDEQAHPLREYLLRGGFFMCDDFHGTIEWENFVASMRRVFPDRPIVEIENPDPIFHVIYDLDQRYLAICHNMDLGDSWEHADNPQYDQKFSALGISIGVNYVIYAMTH